MYDLSKSVSLKFFLSTAKNHRNKVNRGITVKDVSHGQFI